MYPKFYHPSISPIKVIHYRRCINSNDYNLFDSFPPKKSMTYQNCLLHVPSGNLTVCDIENGRVEIVSFPIKKCDLPYKSPFSYGFPMAFLFKIIIYHMFNHVYQRVPHCGLPATEPSFTGLWLLALAAFRFALGTLGTLETTWHRGHLPC